MNLPPRPEAAPAPAGAARQVGEIWREGARFYERLPGGVWELPYLVTFIEREDRTELLRFGARLMNGELSMPLLTADGASQDEVAEARTMCLDEERFTIKRLLGLDDVEWREAERRFRCS